MEETCAAKGKEGKMNGNFFVGVHQGTKMGSDLFMDAKCITSSQNSVHEDRR